MYGIMNEKVGVSCLYHLKIMAKESMNCCSCMHHKFVPLLVIIFATLFLLQAMAVVDAGTTAVVWPLIVGLAGLMKLVQGSCGCCNADKMCMR